METYIFQHVEFEGPGILLPLLESYGHNVHVVKLFAGDPIPHENDIDFAILMGGPMSVLDEANNPYFVREKELCRDMVQLGKPLLGICLGAQMIASAFGAAIRKNPEKEIGWFPVTFHSDWARELNIPKTLSVLHWHGETFDIPDLPGIAEPFAFSDGCKNQAFKLGSAIALQFHLEATPDSVNSMLENCKEDYVGKKGPFIQNKETIQEYSTQNIEQANKLIHSIIESMLKR